MLWNPWEEKNNALTDLHPGAYHSYVCIEPGTVANWVQLNSNHTLVLTQHLKVLHE